MPADHVVVLVQARLDALRTGLADLAFDLERQGRCDAADVVMQIDTRVRELAEEITGIEGDNRLLVGRALCPSRTPECRG